MKTLNQLLLATVKAGGQKAMAKQLEISEPYLSNILNGKSDISISFALRLYDKLGVDPLPLLQWQVAQQWRKEKEIFDNLNHQRKKKDQ